MTNIVAEPITGHYVLVIARLLNYIAAGSTDLISCFCCVLAGSMRRGICGFAADHTSIPMVVGIKNRFVAVGVSDSSGVTAGFTEGITVVVKCVSFRVGDQSANGTFIAVAGCVTAECSFNGVISLVLCNTADGTFLDMTFAFDVPLKIVGDGASAAADITGFVAVVVIAVAGFRKGFRFGLATDSTLIILGTGRGAACAFGYSAGVPAVADGTGSATSVTCGITAVRIAVRAGNGNGNGSACRFIICFEGNGNVGASGSSAAFYL